MAPLWGVAAVTCSELDYSLPFPLGAQSSVSIAYYSSCVPKHVPELQYFCIFLFLSLPNLVWHTLLLNLCPAACEAIVGSGSRTDREAELINDGQCLVCCKGSYSPDPGNNGSAESIYMQVLTRGAEVEALLGWLPLSTGLAGLATAASVQALLSTGLAIIPVWPAASGSIFPRGLGSPFTLLLVGKHTHEHLLLWSVHTTGKPGVLLSC